MGPVVAIVARTTVARGTILYRKLGVRLWQFDSNPLSKVKELAKSRHSFVPDSPLRLLIRFAVASLDIEKR